MDGGSSAYGGEARKRERFGEVTKFLPVLFVVSIIVTLTYIYILYHLWPMLQFNVPPERRLKSQVQRAYLESALFCYITFLLLICYVKSILVSSGEIPDDRPEWQYPAQDQRAQQEEDPNNLNLQETKRSGDRRHCKWCSKYKPDRCHHCRVCRTCILKMDHHCPWIYNCVGFGNHKYFFLLLFYCVLDLHLISWTMLESVRDSIEVDTTFLSMFLLLFGETLAAFLGVLTTAFFGFHIWLASRAMTTIEFCEKSLKKTGYNSSVYDRGVVGNFKDVLGENIIWWFFPRNPPRGDGLTFVSESTRLSVDLEAMRGIKKGRRRSSRTASSTSRQQRRGASGADPSASDSAADRDEESGVSDAQQGIGGRVRG